MKVLYVSSRVYKRSYNAIKDDTNEEFGQVQKHGCALIDDIQFIGGKERTQEEFSILSTPL